HSLLVDLTILENGDEKLLKYLEKLAVKKEYMINFICDSFYANAEELLTEKLLINSNIFTHNGLGLYMCDQFDSSSLKFDIVPEVRTFDCRKIAYIGNDEKIIDQLQADAAYNDFRKTKSAHKALQYLNRI
ncbi:MAG: hypothetical protein ACI8QY_000992, partial [bacterium]